MLHFFDGIEFEYMNFRDKKVCQIGDTKRRYRKRNKLDKAEKG